MDILTTELHTEIHLKVNEILLSHLLYSVGWGGRMSDHMNMSECIRKFQRGILFH